MFKAMHYSNVDGHHWKTEWGRAQALVKKKSGCKASSQHRPSSLFPLFCCELQIDLMLQRNLNCKYLMK